MFQLSGVARPANPTQLIDSDGVTTDLLQEITSDHNKRVSCAGSCALTNEK